VRIRFVLAIVLTVIAPVGAQRHAPSKAPVVYRISFPAPEHHVARVEVTWTNLPRGVLQARMSRSSPGRYAMHEFAKNVYDVHAFSGAGAELPVTRPIRTNGTSRDTTAPYGWFTAFTAITWTARTWESTGSTRT
jgi:hypothetical protein